MLLRKYDPTSGNRFIGLLYREDCDAGVLEDVVHVQRSTRAVGNVTRSMAWPAAFAPAPAVGSRILLCEQTDPKENDVYLYDDTAEWGRDEAVTLRTGMLISELYRPRIWQLTTPAPVRLVSDMIFIRITGEELSFLYDGSGMAALTIPAAGNVPIPFSNPKISPAGDVTITTAPGFLATVKIPGRYLVGTAWHSGTSVTWAAGETVLEIWKNGIKEDEIAWETAVGSNILKLSGTYLVDLGYNDTVEVRLATSAVGNQITAIGGRGYIHVSRIVV